MKNAGYIDVSDDCLKDIEDFQELIIPIKKRSILGRIKRLPKFIKANWLFAKNCTILERIYFVSQMCLILFR